MKKIYFLALHLGYGGVEKAIIDQANLLSKMYDVKIISTYKLYEKPPFPLNDKVEVIYLINRGPNKNFIHNFLKNKNIYIFIKEIIWSIKILYLRKNLMKNEILKIKDGIIISSRLMYTKLLSRYGNKNVIKIAEEHRHHNNQKKYIKKVIKACKKIDYLLPVSKSLTEYYENVMPWSKIKCIYIPHFLDYMPSECSSLNKNNIIAIGRLSHEKGYIDLIECFNMFSKRNNEYVLHIVGDGNEKKQIIETIEKHNLNNKVILHGFKNKDFINKLLQSTSLFLMTSFEESFGIVLIEAMSFGIPCIAFDSAQGATEIIDDNINGYLIKNRDKQAFAKKMETILNDRQSLKSLGLNARKKAEQYSQDFICEKWYNFIERTNKYDEKIF